MNIGMLWFDNSPKVSLDEKIRKAANYYEDKYGERPRLCLINPKTAPYTIPEGTKIAGIQVRLNRAVAINNFWMGMG